MGHLTMAAGAACVALMISSSAFAQVQPTPNPNNPNDAIPEASNLLPYGDPINIETAKKSGRSGGRRIQEKKLGHDVCRRRRPARRTGLF